MGAGGQGVEAEEAEEAELQLEPEVALGLQQQPAPPPQAQRAPATAAARPAGEARGRGRAAAPAPLTPHHNLLYGRDATPTKSSPIAQQRLLSMTAAAQQQQQRRGALSGAASGAASGGSRDASPSAGAASSSANPSHSISFGSGGCGSAPQQQQVRFRRCALAWRARLPKASQTFGKGCLGQLCCSLNPNAPLTTMQPSEQTGESGGPSAARQPQREASSGGARRGALPTVPALERHPRLAALAVLLEEAQASGRHFTLPQLQAAGYSTHDLAALRRALAAPR